MQLQHHLAIMLYARNNEDYQVQEQAGLTYEFRDKDPNSWLRTDFSSRFIYEHFVPAVIKEYPPHRRFNSEFGMVAFPHLKTIKYIIEDNKDLCPQSMLFTSTTKLMDMKDD